MSRTLSMKFGLASGDSRTLSLSAPKENLTGEETGAAMNAMVTNGAAFEDPLTGVLRADLIERTVTNLINNE